jgi:hypothetical protein
MKVAEGRFKIYRKQTRCYPHHPPLFCVILAISAVYTADFKNMQSMSRGGGLAMERMFYLLFLCVPNTAEHDSFIDTHIFYKFDLHIVLGEKE